MKLSVCETIIDEKKFLESHKSIILNSRIAKPYKLRLEKYLKLKEDEKDKG